MTTDNAAPEGAGKMNHCKFVRLPPDYSESDRKLIEAIRMKLSNLQQSYQAQAAPLVRQLSEIEAKYPPRGYFLPEEPCT